MRSRAGDLAVAEDDGPLEALLTNGAATAGDLGVDLARACCSPAWPSWSSSQTRRSAARTQRACERIRWPVRRLRRAAGSCWNIRVPGGSTPSPAPELSLMSSTLVAKAGSVTRILLVRFLPDRSRRHHVDGFSLALTQLR